MERAPHKTKQPGTGRAPDRGRHPADYWPLAALILVSGAVAGVLGHNLLTHMHHFMGFFLCVFALLKIFDPRGFANGLEMYDLLASRWRPWGYLYPLAELALGLAYFGFWAPPVTYALTLALMTFGAIGVIGALRRGLDIACPCMGSVLRVPLSTVTLVEDLGMAVMAAAMLGMWAWGVTV